MSQNSDPVDKLLDPGEQTEGAFGGKCQDLSDVSAVSSEETARLMDALQVSRIEAETHKEELRRTRQELDFSRNKYSELYDFAPIGYFTLDQNGVILEANRTGTHLLGMHGEPPTGKPFSLFVCKDDQSAFSSHRRELSDAQTQRSCDIRLIKKDGVPIDAHLESVVVKDGDGRVTGFRTAIADITEQRRAQESLIRANQEWQLAFNTMPDLVMVLDAQHRIVRSNSAVAAAFGMTEDALAGKFCFELVHGEHRPPHFCPHSKLLADGNQHSAEISEPRLGGMYEVRASPLRDETRQLIGSVHIVRDITARKQMEEALRRSESMLKGVLQAAPIGIGLVSDRTIKWSNEFLSRMTGYSAEELVGQEIRTLYENDEEFERVEETKYPQIQATGRGTVEARWKRKDGTLIDVAESLAEIEPSKLSAGLVFTALDVTEGKRLRAQLLQAQKMEAIGTLAGGIAHDFNNLLTVILGFSDLLLIGKSERDPSRADLEKINQAARSGAELVQRILLFSRRKELEARPLNLNDEIKYVKGLLARTIPKMINIELVLSESPARVNADPSTIEQILLNLGVNAKDAMPDGGKLTVETREVTLDDEYCRMHLGAQPGQYVLLSVSDTGCGMDKEMLNHVFEPFYTTKAIGRGTGLGLAMVYGIVKQHRGYITCESELGVGTTIKIYLPLIEADTPSETEMAETTPPTGTETLLLVDDEDSVRDLAKRILERSGYTVLEAVNGKEALRLYEEERDRISLVILDLIMPEMGGRQCLANLRESDPHVKVLLSSGYASGGTPARISELGARGFLRKPFNVSNMLETIRDILDQD